MKYLLLAFLAIILMASCSSKKELETIDTPTAEAQSQRERGDREGRRGAPPSVDEVFKMDKNGDGLLAKSEVQGRLLERFETIDVNEDGFISKEEFTNAPRPQRRGNRN